MTFTPAQRVAVLHECPGGNPRTPRYVRGRVGEVLQAHGVVVNPLDHRAPYPPLYTVLFVLGGGDEVTADLHEEWLRPA